MSKQSKPTDHDDDVLNDDEERDDQHLGDQDGDDQDDEHQIDQDDDDADDDDDDDRLGEKGRKALQAERRLRREAEKERNRLKREIERLSKGSVGSKRSKAADDDGDDDDESDIRSELEALRRQLAERDRNELVARVAREYGIPDDLHDRLRGDNEDDLVDDAKKIARLLKSKEVETDLGNRVPKKPVRDDKKKLADPARWGLRR